MDVLTGRTSHDSLHRELKSGRKIGTRLERAYQAWGCWLWLEDSGTWCAECEEIVSFIFPVSLCMCIIVDANFWALHRTTRYGGYQGTHGKFIGNRKSSRSAMYLFWIVKTVLDVAGGLCGMGLWPRCICLQWPEMLCPVYPVHAWGLAFFFHSKFHPSVCVVLTKGCHERWMSRHSSLNSRARIQGAFMVPISWI